MTAAPDRRAQLAEAAFEVFTTRGYRNSAVADIVAAAGVSHGSFYNYFTNKREILDAAIDFGLESLGPQLTPPSEPAGTIDEFLDAMTAPLRALYEFAVTNNRLVSLIVFDAAAIDDALTARVIEIVDSVAQDWRQQVEHGVQAGFLRPGLDTKVLGEVMVAMSLVVLLPAQGGAPLPGGLEHVITQIAEFLRAGLARH
ncbi:TetR/AcrR family transcriptional regulator [Mycobacterium sp. pUA109]|uniref:TetR/AcrR family transcriptional regulator n=1 Tax=Mycobacterium sp. pUA109 TaxID=3238982 RepID=UPI00351B22C6